MRRACIGAVVIALVMLGASPMAGAAKPTITGVGDVRCSGNVKFRIVLTGRTRRAEPSAWWHTSFVVKPSTLTCTGTTGNSLVRVQKVKVQGMLTNWGVRLVGPPDNVLVCAPITDRAGGGDFTLQWKAAGGVIRNTQIHYSSSLYTPANDTTLQAPSPVAPVGSSVVTGSYAGTNSSRIAIIERLLSFAMVKSCSDYAEAFGDNQAVVAISV